ncbi:hypothetical protein CHUAL_009249 [Chamberlinius hualienensis]
MSVLQNVIIWDFIALSDPCGVATAKIIGREITSAFTTISGMTFQRPNHSQGPPDKLREHPNILCLMDL